MHIYKSIVEGKSKGTKSLAVLIDPDKVKLANVNKIVANAIRANVDYFFVGGSLILNNMLDQVVDRIKAISEIPVILFPGNSFQISYNADAILFLSLISGRNAELLIGKHVVTAPYLKQSNLEILSTGYMLVDGGTPTTVSYMSNTTPIPNNKPDIAVCTAMAGEMLGLSQLYLDAGSGAKHTISEDLIAKVSASVNVPIIVGGGIKTPKQANSIITAGADIIVVGNAFESDPDLIMDMSVAVHQENRNVIS